MTIYKGGTNIKTLNYGGTNIKTAYYGSTKVFSSTYYCWYTIITGGLDFESYAYTTGKEVGKTYDVYAVNPDSPGLWFKAEAVSDLVLTTFKIQILSSTTAKIDSIYNQYTYKPEYNLST